MGGYGAEWIMNETECEVDGNDFKNQVNFDAYYIMDWEDRKKYFKGDTNINWCKNWVFTPQEMNDGRILMVDTFWGNLSNSLTIEIKEDNIKDFKFVFDKTKVKQIRKDEERHYKYDDVYRLAIGGGGSSDIKYFIDKELSKNIDASLQLIDEKLGRIEWQKECLLREREQITNSGQVSDYFSV